MACCLTVAFRGTAQEFNAIGRGFWLHTYNVMGALDDTGTQVLKPDMVRKCSKNSQDYSSSRSFSFFKDTKSFYSTITSTAGLTSSLQSDFSLSFTLDSVSKGISSFKRTVTGNSLLIMAAAGQTLLIKDCVNNPSHIDENLLRDFAALPEVIKSPWQLNSWQLYEVFLKKHGSHVVTAVTNGSSINQMAFADTSDSYSERDFQVKSCLSLAGPTDVGELDVSMCAGIDQSEITKVSTMTMSDSLVVRGGTQATRNALIKQRTAELIETFLNEANRTHAPVHYTFTSIWDILQGIFAGVDQSNFLRAVNLEYYYLGYLNYGCDYQLYSGQELQKFDFTSGASPSSPEYECTLAPEGCHSDDDCHYKPIWCSCKGPSCVHYKDKTLDTGAIKTTAYANTNEDWGWHGCDWKPGLAGSVCICRSESKLRSTVWKRDNKNAMYYAHSKSLYLKAKNKEEGKEEL